MDVENGERVGPMFHAHVGPIHALLLRDDLGLLFTGSYDTTARCAASPPPLLRSVHFPFTSLALRRRQALRQCYR